MLDKGGHGERKVGAESERPGGGRLRGGESGAAEMTEQGSEFTIDFGERGNSARFCGSGWSSPEADERWCIGGESRLVIPAPRRPAAYVMVLKVRPLVFPDRLAAQRLKVAVNGIMVGDFTVKRRGVRVCRVPWHAIAGRTALEIRFDTPDAVRPAAIACGSDRRMLAIAFTSLLLYADPYEAPFAEPAAGADRTAADAAGPLPLRELMFRFESLGQNCEFGLVQRRCQAEPLGLLRFASTPLPHLLNALAHRFEGLGAPDAIRVEVSRNGREYMVSDTRYGLLYHAWVKVGDMPVEQVHEREARRVPILVRKLIEDLEAAEKIFVFKGMGAVAEEEALPLAAAIRRYGPNTLLLVTLADPAHPAGTVEWHTPELMVAHIERFAPEKDAYDLLLEAWVRICCEAYRLRLAARGNGGMSARRASAPAASLHAIR
jgi:hypothetical protein